MEKQKEKDIVCCPIKDEKGEGYFFGIYITQDYEEDEWEQDFFDWCIYPNGTFCASQSYMSSFEPSEHYFYGGTFDESKFNDYVEQMKAFKEDWIEELQYDDAQFKDYSVGNHHMVFDVKRFEEEFLNKEDF